MSPTEYINTNRDAWNQKTEHHVGSEFYGVEHFLNGRSTLNDIELGLLGDVKGKSILHLQCHFGMDTLSLARLGAKVTGIDFSDKAIMEARKLAAAAALEAEFILSDVYSLPEVLDREYDIVFTSYGTIGWLPDLNKWGQVVSGFLKPGGKFVFAEFHPVVWMYDNDFSYVQYSYFKSDPIVEQEEGTYARTDAPIKTETISWNHSLSEVFTALAQNGLMITDFREYNYSPFDCFHKTKKVAEGRYIIEPFGDKIPLVYALHAAKRSKETKEKKRLHDTSS